jgi:type IV secretion system protein TrbL
MADGQQEGLLEKISPFNETITLFENTINQSILSIGPYSVNLLITLLTIEVVVIALLWASSGGPQLGKALQRIIVVSLIAGFLLNSDTKSPAPQNYKDAVGVVVRSAEFLGSRAAAGAGAPVPGGKKAQGPGGVTAKYTPLSVRAPDTILQRGFDLVGKQAFKSVGVMNFATGVFLLLLAFATVMTFALLALVCALTYIELQLLMVCGLVLLPFGVFRPTAFLAEKVFGLIIAFAIRILVLSLIIGIADARLGAITPADIINIPHMITLLVMALVLCVLAWHAPSLAAGLLTGTPNLSPAQAVGSGAAMVGSQAVRAAGALAASPVVAAAGVATGAVAGGLGAFESLTGKRGGGGDVLSGLNKTGADFVPPKPPSAGDGAGKGGGSTPGGTNTSGAGTKSTADSKLPDTTASGDDGAVKASDAGQTGADADTSDAKTPPGETGDEGKSTDRSPTADKEEKESGATKEKREGKNSDPAPGSGRKTLGQHARAVASGAGIGARTAIAAIEGGVFGGARAVRNSLSAAPSRPLGGAFNPSMYFESVMSAASSVRQTEAAEFAPKSSALQTNDTAPKS